MFHRNQPVRYKAGDRIRANRPLLLLSPGASEWTHIDAAYPEIGEIKNAPFRKSKRLVIHPPTTHDYATLEIFARVTDETRRNYVFRDKSSQRIVFIVQHMPGREDALYIFRPSG